MASAFTKSRMKWITKKVEKIRLKGNRKQNDNSEEYIEQKESTTHLLYFCLLEQAFLSSVHPLIDILQL